MKPLPDIFTSAQFWSSVATIWAAAGAWFTFFTAARGSRKQNYEGILNLIAGIEAELELVSDWASGGETDVGYLQSKTPVELTREHEDWFYPSRQIFSFDTPSLQSFTTSAQLRHLTGIVRPLVRLNYSIHRIFDLHNELRTFVNSHPDLYDRVLKKLAQKPNAYTPDELVYMNIIFGMNLRIHQQLIGGADSQDELCLYKAFRIARKAVSDFKTKLRPEPLPKWYWLLHVIAAYLALNGLWQIARWFDIMKRLRTY